MAKTDMAHRDIDLPPETKAAIDGLQLLSRKWYPTVLAVLSHHGPVGFNRLLEAIPPVSGKVLSDTLDGLAAADLVDRTVVSESPLRVEYELTPAGTDLETVFDEFAVWSAQHLDPVAPTVLVADGDRRFTEMYRRWLSDQYTVVEAHSSEEIEARLDDGVDVVLVAEGIPGVDPGQVSQAVSSDGRSIVVVDERPDFDVLSVDCDEIVRKPLVRNRLLDIVETQLTRRGESAVRRAYGALTAKQSLIESVYPAEALETTTAYADLCARLEELEDRIEE